MIVEILATSEPSWKAYQDQPNQPEGWSKYKPFTVQVTPSKNGWRAKGGKHVIYAANHFHAQMYCHYRTASGNTPSSIAMGLQADYTLVEE